jgi:hypothetical protein
MTRKRTRRYLIPLLEFLEAREAPSASPWLVESFDQTAAGGIPPGWARWDSSAAASVAVSSAQSFSGPNGLALSATTSSAAARTWLTSQLPADFQVSAAVLLNTVIPTQILGRARNLNTATPSYYALSLTRGLQLQLLRVVNGASTVLGTVNSTAYFSQKWVQATFAVSGSHLRAQIYRADTAQYLNTSGQWQSAPVWALDLTDTALTGTGFTGLARPACYTGTVTVDNFSVTLPGSSESFDATAAGTLPANWAQWSSTAGPAFAVSPDRALSAPNGLTVSATTSNLTARAWDTLLQPADVQATAAVYLDSVIPAQVLARGTGLNSATPTYYAVSVTRGLQVQLVKAVRGVATTLGQVSSAQWFNNQWVRATLEVTGSRLRAQVFRPDTAQYLNASGQWQSAPAWALDLTDTAITGPGLTGVGRPASYTGKLTFDDFSVLPATPSSPAPVVTVTAPAAGAALSGVVTVTASATTANSISKVEFYLDNVLRATTTGPYRWDFDTTTTANGTHTLMVKAYDLAGNVGQASETVTTSNGATLPPPTIPQHYNWIRIAELAYSGTPLGALEQQLLQNSVDLVVSAASLESQIHAVAPNTPQLVYTNVTSLYLNLLTDWLTYADAHGLSREEAFYHVAQATPFSGGSASSQPVNWFWGVYRGGSSLTDLTSQAHGGTAGFAFGAAGEALDIGYTEKFREINLTLASGAAAGWSGVLEYVTAVDAAGNPTAWAPLTTLTDTTGGLAHSGQITFDPPADWKPASLGGSARLYYVRFRTTHDGTAPVATAILGRDYVNANGISQGVIPAFDYSADTNHDGYLSDAEYAHRRPGFDARFVYESRDFAGSYGQMRFATNPADLGFRSWTIDYDKRVLSGLPLAAGLFMDNSGGVAPVNPADVLEPAANYAADYGALLGALSQALAPKWILANTAAGGSKADAVIPKVAGYFEEFAIRPLANNYSQFEALAAQTAERSTLTSPAPYAILDSLPQGGSPTDPRTQLATLAYYYLLADPKTTFLDFYGGYSPGTSWSQHWSPAAAYNVGQPQGSWSLFASGTDPANAALTYRVYQRSYSNALVLYKPLSYGHGVTGTLADATATTFALGGTYYQLHSDGTLGPAVTSVTLRNGEGAILVKAGHS